MQSTKQPGSATLHKILSKLDNSGNQFLTIICISKTIHSCSALYHFYQRTFTGESY